MAHVDDEIAPMEPESAADECPLCPGAKLELVAFLRVRRIVVDNRTGKPAYTELPWEFPPGFSRSELFKCAGGGVFRVQPRLLSGKLSKAATVSLEGEPHGFVSPEPVPAPDVTHAREASDVATGAPAAGPVSATAVQLHNPPPGSPTALVVWDGLDPMIATFLTNDARRTAQTIEAHASRADHAKWAAEMVRDVSVKAMEQVTSTALHDTGALADELKAKREENERLRGDLLAERSETTRLKVELAQVRASAPQGRITIGDAFAHFLLRLGHFSAPAFVGQLSSLVGMPEDQIKLALQEASRTAAMLPAQVGATASQGAPVTQ